MRERVRGQRRGLVGRQDQGRRKDTGKLSHLDQNSHSNSNSNSNPNPYLNPYLCPNPCVVSAKFENVDDMLQDLYQNGPLTGMFFVKQDFLAYSSGVYDCDDKTSPMLG